MRAALVQRKRLRLGSFAVTAILVGTLLHFGGTPALAGSGCTPSNLVNPLSEGVATAGSVVSLSSFCEFSFLPGEGFTGARFLLQYEASGGSNSWRLYVRVGTLPTTTAYDCFMQGSFGATQAPPCLVHVPAGATAFARVQRLSGSTNFQITATSENLAPGCPEGSAVLTADVPVQHSRSATAGQGCTFEFVPDPTVDFTRIQVTPDGGSFGTYVKLGEPPTTSSFDCAALTCDFMADDRTVHVLVPYSTAGQFTITASSITVPTLVPGVPAVGTLQGGAVTFYKAVAPPGSRHVSVTMTGPEQQGWACYSATPACPYQRMPDIDMYIYVNRLPTGGSGFACRPYTPGSPESCVFDDAQYEAMCTHALTGCGRPLGPGDQGPLEYEQYQGDGKYFVLLHGYRGPAGYTVVATVA